MVPIPKRSRSGLCKTEDFWGISLLPVAYKAIMCSIAQNRLVHVVEERKSPHATSPQSTYGSGSPEVPVTTGQLTRRRHCSDYQLVLAKWQRSREGLEKEEGAEIS